MLIGQLVRNMIYKQGIYHEENKSKGVAKNLTYIKRYHNEQNWTFKNQFYNVRNPKGPFFSSCMKQSITFLDVNLLHK